MRLKAALPLERGSSKVHQCVVLFFKDAERTATIARPIDRPPSRLPRGRLAGRQRRVCLFAWVPFFPKRSAPYSLCHNQPECRGERRKKKLGKGLKSYWICRN